MTGIKRNDRVIRSDELASMGPGTVVLVIHGVVQDRGKGLQPVAVEHDSPDVGTWEHAAEKLKPYSGRALHCARCGAVNPPSESDCPLGAELPHAGTEPHLLMEVVG
jgi:hypothetical protein